jgi:hypothetical protein
MSVNIAAYILALFCPPPLLLISSIMSAFIVKGAYGY